MPARHPGRQRALLVSRTAAAGRRIVEVVGDELQLILEHELQVSHGVHHVGCRVVDLKQLAQVQPIQ